MPELPDAIARINALTTNARNTWFALLGVLVFVGITLMGVEHIDFYGVDRATQLPLVNVEVPTRFFFLAAPILTAAIYGYFHLYLIRLWDALSVAEPRAEDGRPLGDVIAPWLVTDAALHVRRMRRKDGCTAPRAFETPAMVLNFALAWGFGLFVLASLWWQSMPARSFLMTSIAGLSLVACLACGYVSWRAMRRRMAAPPDGDGTAMDEPPSFILPVVAFYLVIFLSLFRTELPQPGIKLAEISLIGEELVERPEGWLPHEIARKDFRAEWCEREGIEDCAAPGGEADRAFAEEWQARRAAALADMRRPDWHKPGRAKPDLRDANLSGAFLAGAVLRGARMEGANLVGARMEGANLWQARMEGAILIEARMEGTNLRQARMEGAKLIGARMQGANFRGARMEAANLRGARIERANFRGARMEGANLRGARMERAILWQARMEGANLWQARMEGAILIEARMEGTNLRQARMEGAKLIGARMEGADLLGARMEGADLSSALLTGTSDQPNLLADSNLSAAVNDGGATRFVDLTRIQFDAATDFRNAFLDGSVTYTDAFARQMGGDLDRPCQWWPKPLTDAEFYGRWRGWLEHESSPLRWWASGAPIQWSEVKAIPPPDGCEWKTGPMPGADTAPDP